MTEAEQHLSHSGIQRENVPSEQQRAYTLDEIVKQTKRLKNGEIGEEEAESLLRRLSIDNYPYPSEEWEKLSEQEQTEYNKQHFRLYFRLEYRSRPDIVAAVEEDWRKSDANPKPLPKLAPSIMEGRSFDTQNPLSLHQPMGEQLRIFTFFEGVIKQGTVEFDEHGLPNEKVMHHIIKQFYRPEAVETKENSPLGETQNRPLIDVEKTYLSRLKTQVMMAEHTNVRLPAENSMHRVVRQLHKVVKSERSNPSAS